MKIRSPWSPGDTKLVMLLVVILVIPFVIWSCCPPRKSPPNDEPTRAWGDMDEDVGTMDNDPTFKEATKPLVDWATAHAGGNITIEIHCAPHIGGCSVTKKGGYFIPMEVR
jgi:hypothetical protein